MGEIKYKEVSSIIENSILKGKYDDTKKLPTEEELMNEFNVSRNTIRKAIEILSGRGLVYQVQGSGNFLREVSKSGHVKIGNMRGISKDFGKSKIKTKVLKLELVEATKEIAEKMKCEEGTKLYFVNRVRYSDGNPICVEACYYNKDLIPYINKEIAEKSIYKYITEDLKLTIGFADKSIYCDKLNKEQAEILQLEEGDPSLIIDEVVFLGNGYIFDLSQVVYNYKNTKLLCQATFK